MKYHFACLHAYMYACQEFYISFLFNDIHNKGLFPSSL